MNYYNPQTDKYGYIHSIDNVIYRYYVKSFNSKRIAEDLIEIRKSCGCDGWEKLNCPACSKFSWYQNIVHIGSIHICFGKMQSFDKVDRSWTVLPRLRLEVNPNKHYHTKEFISVMKWIRQNCTSGELVKYDYAIDIPYPMASVKVYNSRKEAGLYKGTIYRGQRSKHGFMRIYNKALEQNISGTDLTRVEHTIYTNQTPSFEKVVILQSSISQPPYKLDTLNNVIVNLCLALQANGIDFDSDIAKLNYRRRKKIEPFLYGNVQELEYDPQILDKLIADICLLFEADTNAGIIEDDQGFVSISDDEELPFE